MVQNEPKRLKLSLWVQPSMPVLKTIACQGAEWCAYSRARRQPLTLSNQQRRSLRQSRCLRWHLLQFTWESKATCSRSSDAGAEVLQLHPDKVEFFYTALMTLIAPIGLHVQLCLIANCPQKIILVKNELLLLLNMLYQLRLALGNLIESIFLAA